MKDKNDEMAPFSAKPFKWEDAIKIVLKGKKKMAEFGFFVLGAVVGVPAAIVGLGVYVRAKVCKCDGWVSSIIILITSSFIQIASLSLFLFPSFLPWK